jgi:tryptophan synthase beta chain
VTAGDVVDYDAALCPTSPPELRVPCGLRYHGMAPLVSLGASLGIIRPVAYHQIECFEAARLFANAEGIIPAPETSHAIRAVIDEAVRCRETGEAKCILFNFGGHGLCDLASYDMHRNGELEDLDCSQETTDTALAELPDPE